MATFTLISLKFVYTFSAKSLRENNNFLGVYLVTISNKLFSAVFILAVGSLNQIDAMSQERIDYDTEIGCELARELEQLRLEVLAGNLNAANEFIKYYEGTWAAKLAEEMKAQYPYDLFFKALGENALRFVCMPDQGNVTIFNLVNDQPAEEDPNTHGQ